MSSIQVAKRCARPCSPRAQFITSSTAIWRDLNLYLVKIDGSEVDQATYDGAKRAVAAFAAQTAAIATAYARSLKPTNLAASTEPARVIAIDPNTYSAQPVPQEALPAGVTLAHVYARQADGKADYLSQEQAMGISRQGNPAIPRVRLPINLLTPSPSVVDPAIKPDFIGPFAAVVADWRVTQDPTTGGAARVEIELKVFGAVGDARQPLIQVGQLLHDVSNE